MLGYLEIAEASGDRSQRREVTLLVRLDQPRVAGAPASRIAARRRV
jgi:hypothetical protein